MAYIVMAYIVMACMVMAYICMAYIGMAYIVMAYIVMAYIVMAYIVMAYIVMAYIVMAYIVMARVGLPHPSVGRSLTRCVTALGILIGNVHSQSPIPTTSEPLPRRLGAEYDNSNYPSKFWTGGPGLFGLDVSIFSLRRKFGSV